MTWHHFCGDLLNTFNSSQVFLQEARKILSNLELAETQDCTVIGRTILRIAINGRGPAHAIRFVAEQREGFPDAVAREVLVQGAAPVGRRYRRRRARRLRGL